MDIQKIKDDAFKEALEELKQENKGNSDVLKRIEKYEDDEDARRRTKTIS